ncbi:MAG: cold shock domain-containing protein [Pseudomonadota bacterium]
MRTHGTLAKWNDDRGFGFIKPANSAPDVFVHISAFPRDGVRPQIGELVSFEVEAGPDRRQRAVRVTRTRQHSIEKPAGRRKRAPRENRWPARALTLVAIVGLGSYGYSRYNAAVGPAGDNASGVPQEPSVPESPYVCDGRTMCSQMNSCGEATYFIRNCPGTKMDGDGDGVPCERQWCD